MSVWKHLREGPDVDALDGEVEQANGALLEGGTHSGSAGFRRIARIKPSWRELAWTLYHAGPDHWAERVAHVSLGLQRQGVTGWVAFHLALEVSRTAEDR